jgi:hypothetical protein
MPERRERPTVCRNRVVGEVASHDLPQQFPLLWNRLMHPAQQLRLDVPVNRRGVPTPIGALRARP